jgi:hypothetical protein
MSIHLGPVCDSVVTRRMSATGSPEGLPTYRFYLPADYGPEQEACGALEPCREDGRGWTSGQALTVENAARISGAAGMVPGLGCSEENDTQTFGSTGLCRAKYR